MIIDERTYELKPGALETYLRGHRARALPLMRQYLGEPYGYYVSLSGDLNQFVHLWRYDSLADRESRRRAMYADPRWLAYRRETGETGMVLNQHNRLLGRLDPDRMGDEPVAGSL